MVWAQGHRLQNGKYVIEEVWGQGGSGITYKAWHTWLKEYVVIKTPSEHLKYDPDYGKYVDRFIQEGQRLARFSQNPHPHIVRVRDLFDEILGEMKTPCMVMDFVPGETLFQMVRRRGAIPETELLVWIRHIGEALCEIHQAGMVHRDAHPGNIIVRPNGQAILIDFGIAKELIPSTQSSTGNAGNRGFAPYEQQTSKGSREPTVDVYCLAATLYFAVTGEFPTSALDRKLHDEVLTEPNQLNRQLSETLNQAILKGMELEPKDRPQSMQDWLKLIDRPQSLSAYIGSKTSAKPISTSSSIAVRAKPTHWRWLIGLCLSYTTIGIPLYLSTAPNWIWLVAIAGVVVMTRVVTVAVTWAGIVLMAVPVAVTVAWAWAWAGTMSFAEVGVVMVAVPVAVTVAWTEIGTWTLVRAVAFALAGVGMWAFVGGYVGLFAGTGAVVGWSLVGVLGGGGAILSILATQASEEKTGNFGFSSLLLVVVAAAALSVVISGTKGFVAYNLGAGAANLIWAEIVMWGETANKLSRLFHQSRTSLILAGTAISGLGLGWLIGFVLRSQGSFSTLGML